MQTSISNASPNDNTPVDTAEKVKDVYSLYGRYIIEEHMLDRLDNDNPIEIPMPETETASFKSGYAGNKTVGILGGGVGGLYAAMMLESVGVPYEVLEARDRVGGRLFTHKFENSNFYDYFVSSLRPPVP